MSEWEKVKKERWRAVLALCDFSVVATVIVLIHALAGGVGFRADFTISRYVGLDFWSAGLFILANAAMAWAWATYTLAVAREWKLSRLWYVLTIAGVVMLMVLSLCPVGLFDETWGDFGIVSRLHRFSSFSMFGLMLMTDLGLLLRVESRKFRVYAGVYLGYGLCLALLAALGNGWFWGNTMILESVYLLAYLVMLCVIPSREDRISPDVV